MHIHFWTLFCFIGLSVLVLTLYCLDHCSFLAEHEIGWYKLSNCRSFRIPFAHVRSFAFSYKFLNQLLNFFTKSLLDFDGDYTESTGQFGENWHFKNIRSSSVSIWHKFSFTFLCNFFFSTAFYSFWWASLVHFITFIIVFYIFLHKCYYLFHFSFQLLPEQKMQLFLYNYFYFFNRLYFYIFFSNLYAQLGAWTHNPTIKCCMLYRLSQPCTPFINFLYWHPARSLF